MGQAQRLASNFVVLTNELRADAVAVTPDLYERLDRDHETIRMTEPGTFVIVPRNTWHTARVRRPSIMMFITPGEGTINSEEPDRGS